MIIKLKASEKNLPFVLFAVLYKTAMKRLNLWMKS